jgi:hypothetical protein
MNRVSGGHFRAVLRSGLGRARAVVYASLARVA